MSIAHLLEDFTTTDPANTATMLVSLVELEDQRLAAFEKGYSAGWEDSAAADAQGRARLTESLAQNINDSAFSYHEALSQMQSALVPLFEAISDQLLPTMIEEGLAVRLAPLLSDAARNTMARSLVLSVPPGMAAVIAPLVPAANGVEFTISEDVNLIEGQARVHLDEGAGFEVDLSDLASEMRDAMAAFTFETQKKVSNERSI